MHSRFIAYALVATVAIGLIAVAADALVESDAERIDALADALTEGPADARADAVLAWVDLSRAGVSLNDARYENGDDVALGDAMSAALAPFATDDLDVVQRTVDVDGDRATVALRVRADGELSDATFELDRSGQGWLVTSVRAR